MNTYAKTTLCLLAAVILLGTGYWAGNRYPLSGVRLWVQSSQPPLPGITIEGQAVSVVRGGFSWCSGSGSCSITDSPPMITILKNHKEPPVQVQPKAKIETHAPPGIKEFTMIRLEGSAGENPYEVPEQPGVYYYRIYCEWFSDQGNAEFGFVVEVREK
ncbi:hypothetical protein [Paenibacillus mucilaginosus]|uniref:Uncharacterized protein n=1 Tax=Paenibacillus mucilaginosus (strain KNP414) TaxID=1036673 RepID=F8FEW1_PAEMK|nr:hypothetical protein [Paenibacillus mucilaginosus]AEI46196.1 hypothetical protein KNP414_07710 [Paenibacillus mucilaginosus KNP414]MCG7213673.1 hypothetical protein [Paenibacillus mucilaginosus]WDM27521.1 hypothetical protein KCX80_35130 [Paenibacillus mucilaginosus]